MTAMKELTQIYAQHAEMPYIAPQYEEELRKKPIPKRNMIRTAEGLLPGHIIMLWRINFGTYTTQSPYHKYFYTTYGIDASKELHWLIDQGYVKIDSAFESLRHLPASKPKEFLKQKQVKGLSKMKRADLDQMIAEYYTEGELAKLFDLRSYSPTSKGAEILARHSEIVAKHPQKSF